MKDAQKRVLSNNVSLTNIVDRLRGGQYVIPDFQREFEWKPWDIRELMRSIFLDYYIGSLLLWNGAHESFEALACESLYGFRGDEDKRFIVLDGQQRLTAMYYAFMAPDVPAPSRQNRFLYFIRVDKFMNEVYEEAFDYDWSRRGVSLLADKTAQFEKHMFPLAVVGKGGFELAFWVRDYEQHWQRKEAEAAGRGDAAAARVAGRHAMYAHEFGKHLSAIFQEYHISYIELGQEIAIEKVCDIFTQINSRGIRLDVFDLINALIKPKGLQLKHLWRDAAPKLDFVDTERMNVYILQVMSILSQAYCSPKYLYYLLPGQQKKVREPDGSLRSEVLVPDIEAFTRRWHEAVDLLARTIDRLRHPQMYGAISSQYLPYVSILPAFSASLASVEALPADRQLDANRKLQRWYWASVFMNRYSGAVESTSARDFLDLKSWFLDDAAEPSLIADFKTRFRTLDMHRETKRGTSVYNGIFNLLVLNGAQDWTSGAAPQYGDLGDHHIVPKSWAYGRELDTSIDTILNRTPLTADTYRRVINDRPPNKYLPELLAASGEATVRTTLETHFISPAAFDILLRNPFEAADFEAFVAERQRTFREAIEHLLVKERLDLAPRLRELDARIEAIELALRILICNALEGDPAQLPAHVRTKVEERVQADLKRNPGLDAHHYETLHGKLEYADLRELQDTMTNKALRPVFADRFANKEFLVNRFGQLAGLRNAIRHSRQVDEVTRMDGEAAVLWFEQVLAT